MKQYVLMMALITTLVSVTAFCQEAQEAEKPLQVNPEHQMQLHRMQLELEERETGLDFQRKMRELELDKQRTKLGRKRRAHGHPANFKHHPKKGMLPFLVICFIVHILVAVWVYQDIRKRNSGSGIWIVVALLTGLLGTLVYAIVRLGDIRKTEG